MFVQEENLCVCNKQKVSAMPCNEHINCSDCPSCGGDMFYYLRFLEGYSYHNSSLNFPGPKRPWQ